MEACVVVAEGSSFIVVEACVAVAGLYAFSVCRCPMFRKIYGNLYDGPPVANFTAGAFYAFIFPFRSFQELPTQLCPTSIHSKFPMRLHANINFPVGNKER